MKFHNKRSLARILCLSLLFGELTGKVASAADVQMLGSSIMQPPLQTTLVATEKFTFHGETLTEIATYSITGRVLGLHRYHIDKESNVAPYDLALAWGWLSDESILRNFKFTQKIRRLYYESKNFTPFTAEEIAENSSNNHIIPASDDIADTINSLRNDEVVTLRGILVNVSDAEDWHWETSLSRNDVGDGACEIIYVTEVIVYRDIAFIFKTAPYSQMTALN